MAIIFKCSNCGQELNVPDAFAGKQGKCPGCKGVVSVPSVSTAKTAPSGSTARAASRKRADDDDMDDAAIVEEDADIVEDDEDDAPRKRKTGITTKSRRRDDDEDEDEPRRKKKSRGDDDEDDNDDRPSRKSSSRKSRRDDEDDGDNEAADGKKKKARDRMKRLGWRRAKTGLKLGSISGWVQAGANSVAALAYVFIILAFLAKSIGLLGFSGILFYLMVALFLVGYVLAIVSGAFGISTPGKNGEMALAISALACTGVAFILSLVMVFNAMGKTGGLEALGAMLFLFPIVEMARLSLFCFWGWACAKSARDRDLARTLMVTGIAIPSIFFGVGLLNFLFISMITSEKGLVILHIVAILSIATAIGVYAWFAMVMGRARDGVDNAL